METKFTKGKWRHSKEHECITTSERGIVEGSKVICGISKYPSFDYSGVEAEANALLISKAPEMFEMLVIINTYLSEIEKTNNFKFIPDAIGNIRIKQLLKEATEL